MSDLHAEFVNCSERVVLTNQPADIPIADHVLVLLTAGILQPPFLQQFQDAIRIDAAAREDRIVLLFCESAGWQFGCDEHTSAPVEVKACIDEHEAIAYRPKDPTGPSCHEFPAMVRQLLTKVGAT